MKVFLSPFFNILLAIFLLGTFFMAGQNILQTFFVAEINTLGNLLPQPLDYLWELNMDQAPMDRNKIRYYADYYEQLIRVFPSLWDAYGLLGYCYHYLNDDAKAKVFLKTAILHYPDYFWNYYNLAAIDINESHYQEASLVLQKGLKVDLMTSFSAMGKSHMVYLPLLGSDEKEIMVATAKHLKEAYRTSYNLMQVLNQADDNQEAGEGLKRLTMGLYAF